MLDQCILYVLSLVRDYLFHPAMIAVLLTVVLLYLFWSKAGRLVGLHGQSEEALRYPPGPFALPILGNILLLGSHPHINLSQLADIYGDIYSLRLGSRKVVVLNSVQIAREVLVKNACQFSDRPPLQSFKVNSNNGQSIAFGSTGYWYRYHKKFASRALSKMFENEERFHQIASDEILHLKNALSLDQSEGEPIDIAPLVKDLVRNFWSRLVFGDSIPRRFVGELYCIFDQSSDFVENNPAVQLVDFFPWLETLFKKKMDKIKESVDQLMDFVKRINEARGRPDDCIQDGMQCIAGALESDALNTDERSLSEDSIVLILADMFGAGLETMSTTMSWAVGLIAGNKHLQEELYTELECAIGKSGKHPPSLQDKSKMPLLQATVMEVLRISSVLPLSLPHYCSQDTMVSGYRVDEGTVILLNLWAINHDPKSFKQPNNFNPYRFLDPVTNQLVTDDWMMALPFSTGTRKCLGSTLAKSELFLLMAGLLYNFRFELSGGSIDVNRSCGLTLRPQPFSVFVYKRF